MRHVTVIAKVHRDNSGVAVEIPVVLTEFGPLKSLFDYFMEMQVQRSYSWMQKLVQVVRLLLDYMDANKDVFNDPNDLFQSFVQRLYTGTIGEDGRDPSGLYWLPISSTKTVKQLVNQFSAYSDWVASKNGAKPLNPWRAATRYEEMLNWAAWHKKHDKAFLGHVWGQNKSSELIMRVKSILLKRPPKTDHGEVKRFPDERIINLLFDGFTVPGKQKSRRIEDKLNMRDILITILMHFGGVRMSEPFHLYVHDVLPDPNYPEMAMVRIYHPSEGRAPKDWHDAKGKAIKCNREAYLRGKYGMKPRNQYYSTSQLHAGWKGNSLDSELKYMHVHWFPSWGGELFYKLWKIYIYQRALKNCDHPFAFVTKKGKPYSIDSFEKAFAKAVSRIELASGKMLGTTPHGLRHAYGQRMRHAEIDPVIRMKAMHHHSISSQLIYTQPEVDEVSRTLNRATSALNQGEKISPPEFLNSRLNEFDPLEMFYDERLVKRR